MNIERLTKLFSIKYCKSVFLTLCCFCTLVTLPSHATEQTDILIIKSADSEIYANISNSLTKQIPKLCEKQCSSASQLDIHIILPGDIQFLQSLGEYDLIITLGKKAQHQLFEKYRDKTPDVLHALIPFTKSMQDEHSNHASLVLDQPAERQLAVIKQLLGKDKPVGILHSSSSAWRMSSYQLAASQLDMRIISAQTDNPDSSGIGHALNNLLPDVSSILMIPDKSIYNRSTIAQLLLTGFKNHIPFIGYSKSLVKTGAIASITTEKEIVTQDISRLVIKLLNQQNVDQLHFPSKYKLVINRKILEAMDIDVNWAILKSDDVEVIQ